MRSNRVDRNQADIVRALRQIGAFVQPLNAVKGGCPDLLVGYRGLWHLLECKDGSKPPSGQRLTTDELDWHARACGHAKVHTVSSMEQAVEIVSGNGGDRQS